MDQVSAFTLPFEPNGGLSSAAFGLRTAFQPVVDLSRGRVAGHEALTRLASGQSIGQAWARMDTSGRRRLDFLCRSVALETVVSFTDRRMLSLNISPCSLLDPETGWDATLSQAQRLGIRINGLLLEITEDMPLAQSPELLARLADYRAAGCRIALDDFGAGHANLTLLDQVQPDVVKLDMALVHHIDTSASRRAIVRSMVSLCEELAIDLVAEGVETLQEARVLRDLGVAMQQGYFYAKPCLGAYPSQVRTCLDQAPTTLQ